LCTKLLEKLILELTNAIVSEGYAENKKGFERAAEERARAFESMAEIKNLTKESFESLEGKVSRCTAPSTALH